jgi:hypothetical protein
MHTADDTRGRVRRRRRGGGQWRGQEAQAPGVPARRRPPCARAGMRERRRPARLFPGSGPLSAPPVVGALHALCVFYAHDILHMPVCIPICWYYRLYIHILFKFAHLHMHIYDLYIYI